MVKVSNKELRQFGVIIAVGVFFIFGWLLSDDGVSEELLYIALVIGMIGLFFPGLLGPFYIMWMKLGGVLGWFNTRLILGVIFFVIFAPLGLLMRMLGKDPMDKNLEIGKDSYRIVTKKIEASKMERPY